METKLDRNFEIERTKKEEKDEGSCGKKRENSTFIQNFYSLESISDKVRGR